MKSIRYKQLEKAHKLMRRHIKAKFIKMITEENDGCFYHPNCSGCGEPLDLGDEYSFNYGFCSIDCGMRTFGLSWSDFY
jgi:hypothetical protein